MTRLHDHPRLYLDGEALARMQKAPALPFLQQAADFVEEKAKRFARLPDLDYPRGGHNEHLNRARLMQRRVGTLLAQWQRTGTEGFRRAALTHIEWMGDWSEWSWIAWRQGETAPDAIFDLSYGENSFTLALAYDWLYDSLSSQERALFLDIAKTWSFAAGRKHCKPGGAWWFGKADSNWNTVCAGGLGMLCLAMQEEIPEAKKILPQVEKSFRPYMNSLKETAGGWPEGIGYWNYGMRYAFLYLISHENATGKKHPLLRQPATKKTLSFPMDFCPRGEACSFGDVNHWAPLPFHYEAARRLGCTDVVAAIDAHLADVGTREYTWPCNAEWLGLHVGRIRKAKKGKATPAATIYKGLDWAVLRDKPVAPDLCLTIRGGTTEVPHGHLDLLSFHAVVDGEKLLTDVKPSGYLDSTFSPRRYDLFEMRPESKNTLLINGVGIPQGTALDRTERVRGRGIEGVRLVATSAFAAVPFSHNSRVQFCARLFLLLKGKRALIVDRVEITKPGRADARFHTFADVKTTKTGATLKGERSRMRLAFAADMPGVLTTGVTVPTTPAAPASAVLRWGARQRLQETMTFATLLSPGAAAASVTIETDAKGMLQIQAKGNGWKETVRVTPALKLAR